MRFLLALAGVSLAAQQTQKVPLPESPTDTVLGNTAQGTDYDYDILLTSASSGLLGTNEVSEDMDPHWHMPRKDKDHDSDDEDSDDDYDNDDNDNDKKRHHDHHSSYHRKPWKPSPLIDLLRSRPESQYDYDEDVPSLLMGLLSMLPRVGLIPPQFPPRLPGPRGPSNSHGAMFTITFGGPQENQGRPLLPPRASPDMPMMLPPHAFMPPFALRPRTEAIFMAPRTEAMFTVPRTEATFMAPRTEATFIPPRTEAVFVLPSSESTDETSTQKQPEAPQTPEVEAPTAAPEVTPKVTPEVTAEVTPKATPEATAEVAPKATPEVTPEVAPKVTPKATPEVAPKESSLEFSPPVQDGKTIQVPDMVSYRSAP